MKRTILIISIILLASIGTTYANSTSNNIETANDSLRLAELDLFWVELSRTVREGDFEGYKATYHDDAVVVFTAGKNKTSVSIAKALENWQQNFTDTKTGKKQDNVEFRLSQRVGGETTAHETGIFLFTSNDSSGKEITKQFIHFEMLFVKLNNTWYGLMEYQKSYATEEEWKSLE